MSSEWNLVVAQNSRAHPRLSAGENLTDRPSHNIDSETGNGVSFSNSSEQRR